MTDLSALKAKADHASAAFDAACKPYYCDGRWGAYRAIECGQPIPAPVNRALNEAHAAMQAFYRARDDDESCKNHARIMPN